MAVISSKDSKGDKVVISVHPLRGAILTTIRTDKAGRQHKLDVALTPDDCRELAVAFHEGWQNAVNIDAQRKAVR